MTPRTPLLGFLLVALCLLGSARTAVAQTWNADANTSWNTAGNWTPTVIPNGQGVTAVFGGVITANRTITVDNPVSVGNITFQDAAFSYSLGGNAFLTLDNGASPAVITMASSVTATQTVGTSITALSNVIVTNDSSSILKVAGVNLGTHTFTVNGTGTVSNIGNGFSGSAGSLVVVDGPGALRLESNLSSGVKYVVNGGTLVAANNNAIRADSFTADLVTINNNAVLRFEFLQGQRDNIGIVLGSGGGGQIDASPANGVTTITLSGAVSGNGSLTKIGTGKLALTAVNTYTGETIIRNGTLRLEGNAPLGAAGTLGNATSAVILGDNVGSNSTALLTGGTTAVTVARDISVVSSAAPGTSTVTIGGDGSSSSSAVFSGTLTLNRSVILTTGSFTPSVSFGRMTGTGDVTIAGSGGAVTFTSSASDFTGTITIGASTPSLSWAGTLAISADEQLGAAANSLFFYGGTLRVTGAAPFGTNRSMVLGYVNGVTPSGTIDVQNTDTTSGFTVNSPITGNGPFRKTGPGILTLAAANTNGYSTLVEQGTLRVAGANFLSPNSVLSVSTGATVQLNGFSQQVPALKNPATGNPGLIDFGLPPGAVLTIGKQGLFESTYLFGGTIGGSGDLVKTGLGIQQLGGASSYVGTTTVRQGVIEVTAGVPASGNGALGHSSGGAIRLGDDAFSSFDAVLFSTDKTISGFARPITVAAGTGTRTIGHQLSGSTHNDSTVTFSGAIALEKDLQLYSKADGNGFGSALLINGVVSGSGGLVKIGAGSATLAADNTYTGATTILKGQFIIGGLNLPNAAARSSSGFHVQTDWNRYIGPSFNPTTYLDGLIYPEFAIHDFSPNADRIGDVDVTLSHGKFTYWGQGNGASSESFRDLVIDRGPNTLTMNTANNANTTSATISLTGGLVRGSGGGTLVVVSQNTLGNPDGGDYTRVLAATPPTLLGGGGLPGSTNISIIPWAFHDTDPGSGAATTTETFLTYGPTGLRPLADGEYVTSLTAGGTLNNVRLIATSTTLGQNQTINSLRYGLSANGMINLGTQQLTIASGAILSTSSGSLTISGGEVAFGTAEGVILTSFGSDVVINSVISGSGGLTSSVKSGSLVLNGANTYTGPTTIVSGGITFNSAASFGSGGDPIRNRNGTGGGITYTGAGLTILPNPIEIGPFSTGIGVNNAGTLRLTGAISGTSGITTTFSGSALTFTAGTGTIELRAANTFTGSVSLSSGTLGVIANNNFGAAENQLYMGTINNPTLRFDAADVDLARTIVVGGNLNLNTNGFNAAISGPLIGGISDYHVNKTGGGILTLTGVSNTRATFDVAGGTLRVNGAIAFPSGGGVNVNSGGTLGGSGSIDRMVTVNTGGTLAPGAGVGTLTVQTLKFGSSANATYEWEAGASAQDQIMVTTGPLNLTGVNVTLKLYDRGLGFNVSPDMQSPLITVAGTGSITGFNPANFTVQFTDTPNWSTSQYSLNVVEIGGNTSIVLSNLAPVPEPAAGLAIAGLALGLAAWRGCRGRGEPRTAA